MQPSRFVVTRFGAVSVLPKKPASLGSYIKNYEFEFYTEDSTGGTVNDGVFRPARKHYYSLVRPGQHQKLVAPYRCYFINFATTDPELCEFFDRMPDTGPVWDMDAVVATLREMLEVQDRKSLEGRLWVEGCAGKLLSLLTRQMPTDGETRRGALRHRDTLRTVDRYIREHPEEDLSLKRLGELSCLEPTYLQKLYTAAYGRTPAQRTVDMRITAARIALMEEDTPVGEIAARLGFSSQAYFTMTFKKLMHMTPSAFRAKHRSKTGD